MANVPSLLRRHNCLLANEEEHLKHLGDVLDALHKAGFSLNLRKCSFFTDKIKCLGHVIRPGTLEVTEASTKCPKGLKHTAKYSELRSFLGLCNVYRRFVWNYTDIAAPLYEILKGNPLPKEFPTLSTHQARAFDKLIQAVTSPPTLALPKLGVSYEIDTDACKHQIGCALFQIQEDGERKPIGFWSRTLHPAERNYHTTERECLALVYAIQICRPYIQGEHFTAFTDHSSLRWIIEINDTSGRLIRWRLRLA